MDIPTTRVRIQLPKLFSLTAALALALPLTAQAQVPFAIDGSIPDAGCCVEFQDPDGSIKELGPLNSSTTKLGNIHTASPPMLNFTNPNSSSDIATIWLDTTTDADGDIWLYFAWERDASNGSSIISYEFQKAAADPACNFASIDQTEPASAEETALINSCNPWANRQVGDFMIVWDFGGGATDIILRTFNGSAFDSGVNLTSSGYAYAALNGDSSRGEGAINLTDAIFGSQQQGIIRLIRFVCREPFRLLILQDQKRLIQCRSIACCPEDHMGRFHVCWQDECDSHSVKFFLANLRQ